MLAEAKKSAVWPLVRVLLLVLLATGFNVSMTILFFEMGQGMEGYAQFLNWGQCSMNAVIYILWFWSRECYLKRQHHLDPKSTPPRTSAYHFPEKKWRYQLNYVGLGLMCALNGLTVQTADPHVSGQVQSFLSILSVPVTGISARLLLNERLSKQKVLGAGIVTLGVFIAVLPPLLRPAKHAGIHIEGWNNPFWLAIFMTSFLPGAWQNLWNQYLMDELEVDPLHALMWLNIYAIPFYILYLPISAWWTNDYHGVLWNQIDAVKCFLGTTPLVPYCRPGAYIYVLAFVFLYGIGSYIVLRIIKEESALFNSVIVTLATPTCSLFFSFRWLLGSDAEPLNPYCIGAMIVIPIGIFIYSSSTTEKDKEDLGEKKVGTVEERTPLLSSPAAAASPRWRANYLNRVLGQPKLKHRVFEPPTTRWFQ